MAVANAWVGGTITPSCPHSNQSYFDLQWKKQSNLSFVGSIANKPNPRNGRTLSLSCRCTLSSSEWDWNRWTRHFSDVEQAESFVSVLKFQLEDAIEKEDFQEAAKVKKAIAEATSKDTVAEIMSQLKHAIDEERYLDASRLCKLTGSGLVGWWVACSKDCNDPFGRVVRITPGEDDLWPGAILQVGYCIFWHPLFEIFVLKEADQSYTMQVVHMQRAKGTSTDSTSSPAGLTARPLIPNSGNSSSGSSSGSKETSADGNVAKNSDTNDSNNSADASEEGLDRFINYLKERVPGANFKVIKANPKEKIDDSESMEQIVQDDDEKISSPVNSEGNIHKDENQGGGTDTIDETKHMATKVIIGGILHNKEDTPSKNVYIRSAAEIQDMERDSFILHIPGKTKETDLGETKVEAYTAQSVSELMPLEVANALMGLDKNPLKVSKDVHEIFKNAVGKRNGLSESTSFSRIISSKDDIDPFEGLYVGAFGPLGAELVQLRRKFGHWHSGSDASDVEFFEYVEAVKLTGGISVPVGQVTFRAKIGKGSRNSNRGKYPDDLGVVASYKGQGTVADAGFQNPRWVEGELLQLSGKGMWPYIGGADLGFLYVVPEKSFLVLLNRLKLPE